MNILKAKLLGWGRQKGAKHGYPKLAKQSKTPTGVYSSIESTGTTQHKFLKRDDNKTILENNLYVFNKHHRLNLEYTDLGGNNKFLVFKNTQDKIFPQPLTPSEAIDMIQGLERYLDGIFSNAKSVERGMVYQEDFNKTYDKNSGILKET